MSADWPIVQLKDVTTILGDGLHGTPKYDDNGDYFFINGNNLCKGKIVISETTKRTNHEEYIKHRKNINDRTILVSINGTLGNVALYNNEKVILGKSACYFNVKDDVNKHFVRYIIESKIFQDYIHSLATGSTIKNVSLKLMREFSFRLPPRTIQDDIAKILKSLDDKIHLNTQTNQTLESIAQAIFKSWFVDFEPVKAKMAALAEGGSREQAELAAMGAISGKSQAELAQLQQQNPEHYQQLAETAALFPSAMVESELGDIPEGWEVSDFGSVYVCYDNKRIPLSKMEREKKKGTIPYYGATSVMDYVDEPIFDGIYLLLGEDGSVLKEDGTPFIQYIWGPSWVNNHAHVLQGKDDISTEQLLLFISTQNISAYVTGAVQLKLNQKNMSGIPFIKAPAKINRHFYTKIKVLFEKKRLISEEITSLASLRDSLLPKLLSGEIDLTNLQSEVA